MALASTAPFAVCRLVSIGRYSARFLDALKAKWDEGWLGYEEISLPMLCVQPAC